MTITAIALVNGTNSLDLLSGDITVSNLDKTAPEIRQVVDANPGTQGMNDTTQLYGAATVTLDFQLYSRPAQLLDALGQFTLPRMRPYLVVSDDEWSTSRRLLLRTENYGAPITGDMGHTYREGQVSWLVPDGVWESGAESMATVQANSGTTAGLTYPITYPITYAATTATDTVNITTTSTADMYPVIRMYGPCTAPEITLDTTGQTIKFKTSLVLGAGEYIEVDTKARTAKLNGTVLRQNDVDYSVTRWWMLRAREENTVRYHPGSGVSAGSFAQVIYREAWL